MWRRLREEIDGEFSPMLSVSIFVAFVSYYLDGSFDFSNVISSIFTIITFIVFTYIVFGIFGVIYTAVDYGGNRNVLNAVKVGTIASFVAFLFFQLVGW